MEDRGKSIVSSSFSFSSRKLIDRNYWLERDGESLRRVDWLMLIQVFHRIKSYFQGSIIIIIYVTDTVILIQDTVICKAECYFEKHTVVIVE